ncbi:MAG TPA: DoxX family protein [Ktedonobacteraceae bacterium]|nr:DoxX family protein [Ktedonobacteraceae bacterium]
MFRLSATVLQIILAITFIAVPVSRMFGAPTLQQVLALGVPRWLVWVANIVEVSGAVLLLLGLRMKLLATIGALLIAASMVGATLEHVQAGNLFAELPWTLVFLGLSLIVVLLRWPAVQVALRGR